MSKKRIIILAVLAAILIAGVIFFKEYFGSWPWQSPEPSLPEPQSQQNEIVPPQTQETRQLIMKDVAAKINEISEAKPILGGKWYALRFWFVAGSDKDFYVEYEDGHIMAKLLLEADVKSSEVFYKIEGYFEPGEADWALKSGQDKQFGKTLDLYEYDEVNKNWVKKN